MQWVAAVLPMSCEKHPGRSGDNSGAVCIGGLQERGGSAGEPSWSTRRTQVDFGQKGWNKSDRYPALPLNLYRKGGNTSASVLKDISLPALLLLSMSWVQVFAGSLAWKQGRLGQTGLGGHHSLPTGKTLVPARLIPQTSNDPFPQASIEIAFHFSDQNL